MIRRPKDFRLLALTGAQVMHVWFKFQEYFLESDLQTDFLKLTTSTVHALSTIKESLLRTF